MISDEELAQAAERISAIRSGLITNKVSTLKLTNLSFDHHIIWDDDEVLKRKLILLFLRQ